MRALWGVALCLSACLPAFPVTEEAGAAERPLCGTTTIAAEPESGVWRSEYKAYPDADCRAALEAHHNAALPVMAGDVLQEIGAIRHYEVDQQVVGDRCTFHAVDRFVGKGDEPLWLSQATVQLCAAQLSWNDWMQAQDIHVRLDVLTMNGVDGAVSLIEGPREIPIRPENANKACDGVASPGVAFDELQLVLDGRFSIAMTEWQRMSTLSAPFLDVVINVSTTQAP